MSGTSLDGLDVALVEISGEGRDMTTAFIEGRSVGLGHAGKVLKEVASGAPTTAREIAEASYAFTQVHVEAIRELVGSGPVDLISAHGQTVYHAPPISWQLLEPTPLAQTFGCPVVYNLRQADLAAGGQGAPLTPIADAVFLAREPGRWAVINLGGFANVTLGPELQGRDVCPCNLWLNHLSHHLTGAPYDADGALAAKGVVIPELLSLLQERIRELQAGSRSLGSGDEVLPVLPSESASNVLRTAVQAIALALRDAVAGVDRVFVAGGGLNHLTLARTLEQALDPMPVHDYGMVGIPAIYREAAAWAVLGALSQDGVSISVPSVTGAHRERVAGSWIYP